LFPRYNAGMIDAQTDPRWHRLLGLAVHEFRTPVGVIAGYLRMLLKDRAGPLTDQQRKFLEEVEKSCGRLSGLIAEMSDLANLEAGSASFNRSAVDVGKLLEETVGAIPPLADREISIALTNDAGGARVLGDATRLRIAFASVLTALRREVVTSSQLRVHMRRAADGGQRTLRVAVADVEHIDAVAGSDGSQLGTFDEWRGGSGLSLAIARRILNAHDGKLLSPPDAPKTSAVMMLPEA
jgi:signal transduction histidine kinase